MSVDEYWCQETTQEGTIHCALPAYPLHHAHTAVVRFVWSTAP